MDIKNVKKLIEYLMFDNKRYNIVDFILQHYLDSEYDNYSELKEEAEFQSQLKEEIRELTTECLNSGTGRVVLDGKRFPKYNKKDWEDTYFDSLTYWTLIMTYCEYFNTHSSELPVDKDVEAYYKKGNYENTLKKFSKEPQLGFDISRVETLLTKCDINDIDKVLKEFLEDKRLRFERKDIYEPSLIKNGNIRVYYKHTYMVTSTTTDTYRDDERKWQNDVHTTTLPSLEWDEVTLKDINKDIVNIQNKWYNFFGKKLYRKLRSEMRAEIEALSEISKDSLIYKEMMSFLDGTCHRSDNRTWIRLGARDFLVLFDLIDENNYEI